MKFMFVLGISVMLLAIALMIVLEASPMRVLGLILLFLVGLGLTVGGSNPPQSGGHSVRPLR